MRAVQFFLFIFMVAFVAAFAACSEKKHIPETSATSDQAEIIDSNLTPSNTQEAAEKLVRNGEKLMLPTGFMFADKIFEKALTFDKKNKKARFYRNLLKPFLLFRGFWKRIEPLQQQGSKRLQKDYSTYIAKLAPGGLRDFLYDGNPDFKTEADLQRFIKLVAASIEESRSTLKEIKNDVLDLNLTWMNNGAGFFQQCAIVEISPGTYKIPPCPYTYEIKRSVDRADFEILQQIYAGAEVFLVMATAYDLRELIAVEKFVRDPSPRPSPQATFDHMSKLENFGKLAPDNLLNIIPNLGSEMLTAAKWAYRMSAILCATGKSGNSLNRPNYLFNRGICIDRANARGKPIEETFDMYEQLLQGNPQVIDVSDGLSDKADSVMRTPINPIVVVTKPVADFKSLFPTGYNCKGHPTLFADQSLGGFLPDKNATEFIKAVKPECEDDPRIRN